MVRSVLWIDAGEIAALLGEAPAKSSAPVQARTFRANEPAPPPPPSPPEPALADQVQREFTASPRGDFEDELERFLAWLGDRFEATAACVADDHGLPLAARALENAPLEMAAAGLLARHVDELELLKETSGVTTPLSGHFVRQTERGFSTSTWTRHLRRRFVLVVEGKKPLTDRDVDRARAALGNVFRETL